MTKPRTEAGKRLDSAWPGTHLDRLAWHDAIAAIEAEATAAAEQRLAECFALAEKAILETAATERARLRREIVGLPKRGNRHGGFLVHRAAVLGLLDAPSPASPRQGEPVDVERLAVAWHNAAHQGVVQGHPVCETDFTMMAGLVAEYVRLSEPAEAET